MKDKYRIVLYVYTIDQKYYRVEIKKWYLPIWITAKMFGITNLHCTVYSAEQFALFHSKKKTVVKFLDI